MFQTACHPTPTPIQAMFAAGIACAFIGVGLVMSGRTDDAKEPLTSQRSQSQKSAAQPIVAVHGGATDDGIVLTELPGAPSAQLGIGDMTSSSPTVITDEVEVAVAHDDPAAAASHRLSLQHGDGFQPLDEESEGLAAYQAHRESVA